MNLKTLLIALALLASATTLAPRALAKNGADDPVGHVSGGNGGSSSSDQRARQDLLRDASSPDADVRGHVEVRSRGDRQRFKVEVEHLDPSASVEILVEDGSGTPGTAGTLVVDALGHAELELDTGDGATLPAGAASVADLAGRRIEVRDGNGALLLEGTVPSLDGTASANFSSSSKVKDADSGVRAVAKMKVSGKAGRQEFRLDVKKAGSGASVELWIDDGTGTLVLADTLNASRSGKARLRLDSRRGHGMPLGVLGIADLADRDFELRVDGVTVASGNLPTL